MKRMKTNMVASVDCLAASAESKKNPHCSALERKQKRQTDVQIDVICVLSAENTTPQSFNAWQDINNRAGGLRPSHWVLFKEVFIEMPPPPTPGSSIFPRRICCHFLG